MRKRYRQEERKRKTEREREGETVTWTKTDPSHNNNTHTHKKSPFRQKGAVIKPETKRRKRGGRKRENRAVTIYTMSVLVII